MWYIKHQSLFTWDVLNSTVPNLKWYRHKYQKKKKRSSFLLFFSSFSFFFSLSLFPVTLSFSLSSFICFLSSQTASHFLSFLSFLSLFSFLFSPLFLSLGVPWWSRWPVTHNGDLPWWRPAMTTLFSLSFNLYLYFIGWLGFFFYLQFLDLKFVGGFGRLWLWVYGGSGGEFVVGVWLNLIGFVAVVRLCL